MNSQCVFFFVFSSRLGGEAVDHQRVRVHQALLPLLPLLHLHSPPGSDSDALAAAAEPLNHQQAEQTQSSMEIHKWRKLWRKNACKKHTWKWSMVHEEKNKWQE